MINEKENIYETKSIPHVDPSMFEFVQVDERIFDKKFETKPIGYFKDAMIRFTKNKTNVTASIILAILILLSIIVPVITPKNYKRMEDQVAFLPPRVPLIEKLGILDGIVKYTDQPVRRETIDPDTGIGLPEGKLPQFIIPGSVKMYTRPCHEKNEFCYDGVNIVRLREPGTATLQAKNAYSFVVANNPILEVKVTEIFGTNTKAVIRLALAPNNALDLGEITEPGTYRFNINDLLSPEEDFDARVQVVASSDIQDGSVTMEYIKLFDSSSEEPIVDENGYYFSVNYVMYQGNGIFERANGIYYRADFEYNIYADRFFERRERAMSEDQYLSIINANPSACVVVPNSEEYPDVLITYKEGCPIKRVVKQNEPMVVDGKTYNTYDVVLDYMRYKGYEKIPYYLFGTDYEGKDYFALLWYGLRTSLFVGVVVAFINISIGIVYGAIEGYYGGWVDLLMERFTEIIGRIPFLVWLSFFLLLFKKPGPTMLILLLTVTGWLGVASVTRTQFYRYKGREYVLASRTLGAKDSRIIFRHILPNGIGTIITASVLMVPAVIFSESTVSYLGYGIGRGTSINLGLFELSGTSIGVLLAEGRTYIVDKPYLLVYPTIIISILMITFNMFGNALRDAFNPSLRGSE